MQNIFHGLITAVITPFKNGRLDMQALERIIKYQIDGGVDALVVAGSTGEVTSLKKDEYNSLLKAAVSISNKRIPIIAGISSSNTDYALTMARIAEEAKVDGVMCTVPAYSRPNQEGIYQHFTMIHNNTKLPIMLYTVPSRTGSDLTDSTILRLSGLPRIKALKDAGSDIERPLRINSKLGSAFNLLAGNDTSAVAYFAHGGTGLVSVVSNVVPKLCKKLCDNWFAGDSKAALKLQQKLYPLNDALSGEPNPISIKHAVSYLGLCEPEMRLPLIGPNFDTKLKIQTAIDILESK